MRFFTFLLPLRVFVFGMTCAAVLSACGNSPTASIPSFTITAPPPPGESVAGKHYNVTIKSDVDGEDIAMTFYEPTTITGGETYPLLMNSHGFGGSRRKEPNAFFTRLRDAGYAILTIDQRGHGDSGGQIEALNPAKEGKDLSQALDWVEGNIPWIRYEFSPEVGTTNLALGTFGSSYGGGFQHTLLSWDEKQRLDAMVPDITWHHLTYSFAPNLVLKTAWVTLLEAAGTSGSQGRQADWIHQAYIEATTTNNVSDEIIEQYFDAYGMNAYCSDNRPHRVDALYTQGMPDVLFNLNEAFKNYSCVSNLGGDVRLWTHQSGHVLPNQTTGTYTCGTLAYEDVVFAWFEEKLMHVNGAADFIPEVCMSLAEGDAVHLDEVQVGSTDNTVHTFTITNFVQGNAGPGGGNGANPPIIHELGTADGTMMIAGIPTITVDMEIPLTGGDGVGDPRVFIGIGVQKGGSGDWVLLDDQAMPFRGYAPDEDQLVGVAERLEAGDKYGLMFYAWEFFFAGSAARDSEPAVDINVTVELPLVPVQASQ